MFEWLASPEAWVALFTLAALEIVLGIDNIIFISILVGRLPEHQRQSGRLIGLGLAMGMRILLLLSLLGNVVDSDLIYRIRGGDLWA